MPSPTNTSLVSKAMSYKKTLYALPVILAGLIGGLWYEMKGSNTALGSLTTKTTQEAFQASEGQEVSFTYHPVRFKEFSKGIAMNGKAWDFSGPQNQAVDQVWVPKGTDGYELSKTGQALKVTGTVSTYKNQKEIVATKLEPSK